MSRIAPKLTAVAALLLIAIAPVQRAADAPDALREDAASEPAARQWKLSSEVEGASTDEIVRELGLEVGARRVFRNLYRTQLGTESGQIGTVRWTSIERVVEHVETPLGLAVIIDVEARDVRRSHTGNPPPNEVEWIEHQPAGRLIHGCDKAGYLVRNGYVYELYDTYWHHRGKELWQGVHERLPYQHPEYFFPLSDGLRWSTPETEAADLEALRAFESGAGPAPNPGSFYWVAGCSPFDGDPPEGIVPICWYDNTGTEERWIEPGVGLVREMYYHHGTLIEWERDLIRPR